MKKYILKTPLLALLFVATIIAIMPACKENDDLDSSTIQLLSFGPAGVKHGEKITFIGRNLDKVTSIEMVGSTVEKASFVEQNSEKIVIVVPNTTERGKVTLKTPSGDIVSKAPIDFEVPVKITAVPATAIKPGQNLTITGEFLNWINAIEFADGVKVTEFVSKSLNQLVVKVPMEAKTGKIQFSTGGTEPLAIESEKELAVILPAATSLSPNPVEREANLTITGTNLDLVKGVLFKGTTAAVSQFVSKTATQIVVKVPKEAGKGAINLVTFSDVKVPSAEELKIVGDLPPLAPLATAFYVDAFQNGWGKWGGWGGGSSVINSTENVRDGSNSIKVTFGGDWGGPLQFGGGNSSTSGKSKVVFSLFGGPGTNGKKINAVFKGGATESKTIEVVEGEWTEFQIPLSDFGNPANITEVFFQDQGWAGTVFIDHIGLR